MSKITLDRDSFKALASDTRLEILKTLDGRKMSLKEISASTKLNKATLHEHLTKLVEAGFVKRKQREGHKWVYYKLSWKGQSLLHPDNTKVVILFTFSFLVLTLGVLNLFLFIENPVETGVNYEVVKDNASRLTENTPFTMDENKEVFQLLYQNQFMLYSTIVCLTLFVTLLILAFRRMQLNKKPRL